jgi:hypothetical protein
MTSLGGVTHPSCCPLFSTSLLTDKQSGPSRKGQIRENEPNKSERRSSSRVRVRYPSDRLKGRSVSMLEQWQCAQHRMRTVRRRIYAAHLTVCRGIIEQLEQVEIDAFPTAFVTD